MAKYVDLTGKRFHYWLIIKRVENNKQNKPMWLCECNCGNKRHVGSSALKSGKSKSCGCFQKEVVKVIMKKHGKRFTPEYNAWRNMLRRCFSPKNMYYKDYGARGITVCKDWRENFENFYRDMGDRPSPAYSLDRIDVNGNYEPSNCTWSTMSMQVFNQRKKKTNTSGATEVKKGNGAWVAQIGVNRKRIALGTFKSFEEAVEARKQAEKYYWNKPS